MAKHIFHNPLHDGTAATYDAYEVQQVAEYPDRNVDGKQTTFCEPVQEDGPGGDAIRTFWTIYGHTSGQGVEALIDVQSEQEALATLNKMGIPNDGASTKKFLFVDSSGRGVANLLDEAHIRSKWDLSDTDDNDETLTLNAFLRDAELTDEWNNGCDTLIRTA